MENDSVSEEIENIVSRLVESEDDFGDEDLSIKDLLGPEPFQELYKILESGLLTVHGHIKRTDHHYVHEKSTTCYLEEDWNWMDPPTEEQQAFEARISELVGELEKDIDTEMVYWNKKIYRELEAAYDSRFSEENAIETILANDYRFLEDGDYEEMGDFTFDQLDNFAKKKAIEHWIRWENEGGDDYWSESIIAEWKWLLKNKGFEGIEISFKGFSSQGDGASFTAKNIDIKTYLTGPDPLEFPEQNRDQISENEKTPDAEEDPDLKSVYYPDRKHISNIRTQGDYEEFRFRFQEFMSREGIRSFSDLTDEAGNTVRDEFSKSPCECCRRPLAGERTNVGAWQSETRQILTFWVCQDCEYFAEYGQLDDTTMMDIEKNPVKEALEPEDFEDAGIKDIMGEAPLKPEECFLISSSHGTLRVKIENGTVISTNLYLPGDPEGETLKDIESFDVEEWKETYNKDIAPESVIDILDFGYYLKNGTHEPPAYEWRADRDAAQAAENQPE